MGPLICGFDPRLIESVDGNGIGRAGCKVILRFSTAQGSSVPLTPVLFRGQLYSGYKVPNQTYDLQLFSSSLPQVFFIFIFLFFIFLTTSFFFFNFLNGVF